MELTGHTLIPLLYFLLMFIILQQSKISVVNVLVSFRQNQAVRGILSRFTHDEKNILEEAAILISQ